MQLCVRRTLPRQDNIGGNRENLASPIVRPEPVEQSRRVHHYTLKDSPENHSRPDEPQQMNFTEIAAIWPSPSLTITDSATHERMPIKRAA